MTTEDKNGASGEPETVLDAINEALGLGDSGDEHVEDQDTGDDGAGDADDLLEAGDDSDAAGDSDETDQGGESGEGNAGADQHAGKEGSVSEPPKYADLVAEATKLGISERHANGRLKSSAEIAAEVAAKKGDGKAGEAAAGKKQPDPVADPIPKDLKPETQQRIRTLIDRTKEAETRATEAQQNFDYMVNGLQAVGATPEQYGETLSFLALFNSNDPKQQGQALEILEDMADKLATLIGVERKSTDPLAAHADLQAAVQKREITPQYARQIAISRNQGAFRTELNTHAQQTHQQQQAAQQQLQTARNDLNTLEATLSKTDPNYARKKAAIVPMLKPLFARLPPSQWKGAFEEAYRNARVGAPAQQRTKVPTNQPMRAGKNPAGSGASASGGTGMSGGGPATMLDAVNAALSGRR
jgi:hypothetical protein